MKVLPKASSSFGNLAFGEVVFSTASFEESNGADILLLMLVLVNDGADLKAAVAKRREEEEEVANRRGRDLDKGARKRAAMVVYND